MNTTGTPRHLMSDDDLLSTWDYPLPDAAIAKRPTDKRSDSRLLHIAADGSLVDRQFRDITTLLRAGDVLVVNDSSVVRARLTGRRPSGGRVELLLIRPGPTEPGHHDALCLWNSSKPARPGDRVVLGTLGATVVQRCVDEPSAWLVRFDGDPWHHAAHHGSMPLPPYMQRPADERDDERYQTVYRAVEKLGSSAAPTAGLHFDAPLLAELAAMGVIRVPVTLHVGPGTFLPVRSERLSEHQMHAEQAFISADTAAALAQARAEGRRIVAVGTTAARTLESCWRAHGAFVPYAALTRLFIQAGQTVGGFDALITNFHTPKSTLLVLVGALIGRDRLLAAYHHAIDRGYRLLSYGDASFVEVDRELKKKQPAAAG
jgi:S-adenosylmethionine:tRNA ribosyltransferase-isomerase